MRRSLVWSLRVLAGLAVVLVLGLGGGYLWLRGSLPQIGGTLRIAALEGPVEVQRDADGIVTIRAGNEWDAAVALGYVHAQDRLWQMDFMRRTGAGRLSEVVGSATLRLDHFMRVLGLYRVAEANLEQLSPAARALAEAYAAGVNAFIEAPGGPWQPEFYLLRYRPEPWRPADSLVWGRLMALQLSGNWSTELLRARLAKRLTPEQVAFLWPAYPTTAPVTLGDLAADLDGAVLRGLARVLPWRWAPKDASNSWALDGRRTDSGRPLLANDPHLALTAPGTWYLARIETPGRILAGATAPGVPFVVAGRNDRIAWGLTTTHGDTQDIFVERLAEDDPGSYLTPDGPKPFATREEVIGVRGGEGRIVTLRETRHGPVISDVISEAAATADPGTVLALAWPALRADDRTGEALYRLNRARGWDQFRAAIADFHSPQQNLVYADVTGTIGVAIPGRVPLRRKGDGRAPVPGWTGEYDWAGFVPFDELPTAVRPPSGRIVTANNKAVPDDYPHLITADWPEPYRAQRIHHLLDEGRGRSLEGSLGIQRDDLSLAARALLPLLLAAELRNERDRLALSLLAAWDGRMGRQRPEPLIFHAWLRELTRLVLADELGPDFEEFQFPKPDLMIRVLRDGAAWCDNVNTEAPEDCGAQLSEALESALNGLALRFQTNPERLRWGAAHVARFSHPVYSRIPVLRGLIEYEVETDGGSFTINRAGVRFNGPEDGLFEDIHGPGYRAVYDLGDLDNSRFMIATGQSGNPLSPHYGNLVRRWRDGFYVKLDGGGQAPHTRLRLLPE